MSACPDECLMVLIVTMTKSDIKQPTIFSIHHQSAYDLPLLVYNKDFIIISVLFGRIILLLGDIRIKIISQKQHLNFKSAHTLCMKCMNLCDAQHGAHSLHCFNAITFQMKVRHFSDYQCIFHYVKHCIHFTHKKARK